MQDMNALRIQKTRQLHTSNTVRTKYCKWHRTIRIFSSRPEDATVNPTGDSRKLHNIKHGE